MSENRVSSGSCVVSGDLINWNDWLFGQPFSNGSFQPQQVIFRPPRTIVKWEDGTVTIVKCASNEEFNEEHGLAMAFVRRAFPNRSEWIRVLENAHRQQEKDDNGKEKEIC